MTDKEQEKGYDEEMTNVEFRALIKAIITILRDDGVSEKTIKKIEDLIK